ncbi:hypothetical protein A8806_110159 [Faecalicatena orotica]|uniref:Uncharacterized protein n=1 Tax=Faecalicatena orotica TaxID=1544 RepID=A0A2Y9BMA5_9FIRM|nr:hypothetical protein [Faecalicatena orotica]PWJ27984.1 hypothetical protein A8806_110159 [Faecalicatena orotica]SSA57007.1 hypothetical protein SAMN05216536_110159 [Faecalicatena orotica]
MKAVKGNKEYTIDETQKKQYQDAGFDIMGDGEVIAYGRGKTVPYDDHMKAVKEIERLREMIAELREAGKETEPPSEPEKETVKKAGAKKAGE